MLKRCTCDHKYQDKRYGRKIRVFNKTSAKQGDHYVYRCTICGNEKT